MSQRRLTDYFKALGAGYTYYPSLVALSGSINAALVLSLLIRWDGRGRDRSGWIYKTQGEIERETGIKKDAQLAARKELKRKGYLEEKYKGIPRKLHFRLIHSAFNKPVDAMIEKAEQYQHDEGTKFEAPDEKTLSNQHNKVSTPSRGGFLPLQGEGFHRDYYKKNTARRKQQQEEQDAEASSSVVVSPSVSPFQRQKTINCAPEDEETLVALNTHSGLLKQYGEATLLRAFAIAKRAGRGLSAQDGGYIRGICANRAVLPREECEEIDPIREEVLQVMSRLAPGSMLRVDGRDVTLDHDCAAEVDGRMIPRGMLAGMIVDGTATFIETQGG